LVREEDASLSELMVVAALQVALDVYEEESNLFFEDRSREILKVLPPSQPYTPSQAGSGIESPPDYAFRL
jgi:hypothetical protein